MNRFLAGLLALLLLTAPALGQQRVIGVNPDNEAVSNNPVVTGCEYDATPDTYDDGDAARTQCDANGNTMVGLVGRSETAADGRANTSAVAIYGPGSFSVGRALTTYPYLFNGSTWDRPFACDQSAQIAVAAGTTTEIVAASGSTNIRVCAFVVTGDTAATTVRFRSGTGTNCGTFNAWLTGEMRLQDEGNISIAGAPGMSLFRAGASQALCVATATGAVAGFVTYDQF